MRFQMASRNSSKVKVWSDPWLRNGDWGFVTSLVAMGVEDLAVSDLIDHNAHVWRTNIINRKEMCKLSLLCPSSMRWKRTNIYGFLHPMVNTMLAPHIDTS
jgi:hypothetical protein